MEFLSRGEKLREIRKRLHIEQKELEEIGVTRNFISMVESDKRKVGRETAKLLAEVINKRAEEREEAIHIDENYFLNSPTDDARNYCNVKLEENISFDELNEISSIADKYSLTDVYPKIYLCKADLYFKDKNFSEAFTWYYNALEGFIKMDDLFKRPYIYNQLGKCRGEKLDNQEALSYFDKANRYALELGDNVTERYSLYNLARINKHLDKYDIAIDYIEQFINLCNMKDNFEEYMMGLILKANCYIECGEYWKAVNIYEDSLKTITDDNNPLLGFIYNNLGQTYLNMGLVKKSLDNYKKSEAIRSSYDKPNLYRTLIDSSRLYIEKKDYSTTIELLESSINLALENKDEEYVLKGYNFLEEVYTITKDNDKLEQVYLKMLNLLNSKENESKALRIYMKLSLLKLNEDNTEKCKNYLIEGIKTNL